MLSGGGSYGAWEAGLLWGLTHYGETGAFDWDVSSGISAGAINTAGFILFKSNESNEFTEFLSDRWREMVNSDVYLLWDNPVKGIFTH